MRVVTAEEIRELDRTAIHDYAMPGVVLMENAGAAVVAAAGKLCGDLAGKRAAVFCGGGNNGGDGFVIARLLLLHKAAPVAIMLVSEDKIKGDALTHYQALKHTAGADIRVFAPDSPEDIGCFDLIFDALLGTGLHSAPREPYASAIRIINKISLPQYWGPRGVSPYHPPKVSAAKSLTLEPKSLLNQSRLPSPPVPPSPRPPVVISVDLPSGVNSDSGAAPGEAVKAHLTVTFAYPKMGLFCFPGADCAGELVIDPIGFDWDQIPAKYTCRLAEPEIIGSLFEPRPQNANKGDFGHVGIIAGSRGMAGAPALVARAAQRAGAGLVTVLTAESAQPLVAAKLDEQMTEPLPEQDGSISDAAFERIAAFSKRVAVLCIGPGLTTHPGTVKLVHRLVSEINVPIVLDADGLNALAMKPEVVAARSSSTNAPFIITPHPGEAARLLGTSIEAVESNRIGSVRELAHRYNAVALLKGRYTVIAVPSGDAWVNCTGNPGMASGGMGDTLTGIIGGLVAQSFARRSDGDANGSIELAALAVCSGVYIHGASGDIAAREHGEAGTTAGDVIEFLPRAILELQRSAT